MAVTAPYSINGGWNLPRPRIAVPGAVIAVTDLRESKVHLSDIATFTESQTIKLEGAAPSIVAVGGSGTDH